MKYNILAIPPFDRQLKILAKKYPSLKGEVKNSPILWKKTPHKEIY